MFRDRNIRGVVLARLVSAIGIEASFFVGLWGKAAYEFDGSVAELAWLAALITIASIIGNLIAGIAVDRFDARRVMVAGEVAFVPATLALIWAGSLEQLLVFGFVSWIMAGLIETALMSMPPALVEDEGRLQAVNARFESAGWIAMVAGPGAGAAVASIWSLDAVFVFDAATSLVALALLIGVELRRPDEADVPEASLREVRAGLAHAYTHHPLRTVMLLGSLTWLGFGVFFALEPLYFRDVLGEGPETIGWVNSVFGVGLVAGSIWAERTAGRRYGYVVAVGLTITSGLASLVYVGSSQLAIVVVGAVVWSVPIGALLPQLRTLAQRATRPGLVGRVMGAIAMQQNAAAVVPIAFAPALAAAVGVQAVLVGSGLFVALLAPLFIADARRLDRAAVAAAPDL